MLQLRIRHGDQVRTQSIAGDTAAFGRAPGNDVLLDNEAVSRRHARLSRRGSLLFLEDLGGPNGTRLNNQVLRGETREIGPDDTIGIGPFVIRIEEPDLGVRAAAQNAAAGVSARVGAPAAPAVAA